MGIAHGFRITKITSQRKAMRGSKDGSKTDVQILLTIWGLVLSRNRNHLILSKKAFWDRSLIAQLPEGLMAR